MLVWTPVTEGEKTIVCHAMSGNAFAHGEATINISDPNTAALSEFIEFIKLLCSIIS